MQARKLSACTSTWTTGIRPPAQQDVANALSQYGDKIEVVFCNNDAMALGALQSIQQANRTVGKDIYLVGVDALAEAVQDVLDGNMTGTVLNETWVRLPRLPRLPSCSLRARTWSSSTGSLRQGHQGQRFSVPEVRPKFPGTNARCAAALTA